MPSRRLAVRIALALVLAATLHAQGRWNDIPMCRRCVVHEYQFSQEWIQYWLSRELLLKS